MHIIISITKTINMQILQFKIVNAIANINKIMIKHKI